MSVARPVRPTSTRSLIWKTFFMSQPMVWFLMPYRMSLATATQSFPAIAITAAPLYCMMLDMAHATRSRSWQGAALSALLALRSALASREARAAVEPERRRHVDGGQRHLARDPVPKRRSADNPVLPHDDE